MTAPRALFPTWIVALLFAAIVSSLPAAVLGRAQSAAGQSRGSGQARVLDLDDRTVDPLQAPPGIRAIVLIFASVDCAISNRYAPEVRRLHDTYAARGVRFWLVYPNPAELVAAIRDHVTAFAYPIGALRDPRHDLVRLAEVTVTPEAAVFNSSRTLIYHGRIDDRYADIGVDRQVPGRRDLEEALVATLAGRPPAHTATRAVGCVLADFIR